MKRKDPQRSSRSPAAAGLKAQLREWRAADGHGAAYVLPGPARYPAGSGNHVELVEQAGVSHQEAIELMHATANSLAEKRQAKGDKAITISLENY